MDKIPELVSEENSLAVFLLVSVVLGGGAAWLAGRAIAATWRPWWHIALYMLVLSLAVRFLHCSMPSSCRCTTTLSTSRSVWVSAISGSG
jgi:hypothetical protein